MSMRKVANHFPAGGSRGKSVVSSVKYRHLGAVCAAVLFASPALAQMTAPRTVAFATAAARAAQTGGNPAIAALTQPAPAPAADTSTKLEAYLAQAPAAFSGVPGAAIPPAAVAEVSATPASGATPDKAAIDALTAMTPADAKTALPTNGISAGQAVHPFLPTVDDFDHASAQAIIAAFQAPKGKTADDAAQPAAADAPDDPAFDERVGLVTTLYRVDGTDAIIRHYVDTEHMKLIITEVGNHIDISKLSDTDKYRLAAIAAVAQTELEDKIITLNARIEAANLSKDELTQLITAYDNDAQRQQTQLRLHDDGKQDTLASLDISIAERQILRDFIAAN